MWTWINWNLSKEDYEEIQNGGYAMKKKRFLIAFLSIILLAWVAYAATNKADWGDDVYIDPDGIIYAGQGISLSSVTKTSWGSVVSPWEDSGTTTLLTSAPTKFVLTHSSGDTASTGFTAGTGDITLENDQTIDGGTNNAIIFGDNSDTATMTFSGNDIVLDSSDGGFMFTLTDATNGTIDLQTNNDSNDYIQISTSGNQPVINFVGCDGSITAASGAISFGNENLSTTGTLSSGATTVTSLIAGDETLSVATDDQFQFKSNDNHTTIEVLGYEAKDAVLLLDADQGDDNSDSWFIKSIAADNDLHFLNHSTLRLTMSSAGNILTSGDIEINGTTPKLTIGDAGAEDTVITFDGNAKDYYIGLDDTDDDLDIGLGAAPGTTPAISIDENQNILIHQNMTVEEFNFAADNEANDTYVITLAPAPAALTTGMVIIFTAKTANTGACTVNVNGLGAKALKMLHDQDPADNYIEATSVVMAVYDGTSFLLMSPDCNP